MPFNLVPKFFGADEAGIYKTTGLDSELVQVKYTP